MHRSALSRVQERPQILYSLNRAYGRYGPDKEWGINSKTSEGNTSLGSGENRKGVKENRTREGMNRILRSRRTSPRDRRSFKSNYHFKPARGDDHKVGYIGVGMVWVKPYKRER